MLSTFTITSYHTPFYFTAFLDDRNNELLKDACRSHPTEASCGVSPRGFPHPWDGSNQISSPVQLNSSDATLKLLQQQTPFPERSGEITFVRENISGRALQASGLTSVEIVFLVFPFKLPGEVREFTETATGRLILHVRPTTNTHLELVASYSSDIVVLFLVV